jgi:4-amino-4-deoxy-L-arabinose transferase-like glycosyltransferase
VNDNTLPNKIKELGCLLFPSKLIFFLFLLSLLIRLSFVTLFVKNHDFLPTPDQIIHHHMAICIDEGKGLILPKILLQAPEISPQWVKDKFKKWEEIGFWGVAPTDKPQTSFEPLHPIYLAIVYKLFGINPIASRIIQSFISAFTCLILYHLTKKLIDLQTAMLSYIISIFYPYFIYYTGVLLSETITLFLVCLFLFTMSLTLQNNKSWFPILSGLLIGLIFLSKSVFLPFFLLSTLIILMFGKSKIKNTILFCLFFIIVISPWVIRNYGIYKTIIISPTKGGWNLWERNNYRLNPDFLNIEHPELEKSFSIITDLEMMNLKRKDLTYYPDLTGLNEPQKDKVFKRMFRDFVLANPIVYLKLCYIRFFELFQVSHVHLNNFIYKVIAWLTTGPVLIFGTIGGLMLLGRWRQLIVLYLLMLYYIPIHIMTTASPRYRLPIEPIFIIFASYFICHNTNKIFIRNKT